MPTLGLLCSSLLVLGIDETAGEFTGVPGVGVVTLVPDDSRVGLCVGKGLVWSSPRLLEPVEVPGTSVGVDSVGPS